MPDPTAAALRRARGYVDSVCALCAERAGGTMPPTRMVTHWHGNCDACGQQAALCSVGDYDWPRGKPPDWRGTGRD